MNLDVPRRSAPRDAADVVLLFLGGLALLGLITFLALRTGAGARVDRDVVASFEVDEFHPGRITALLQEIRIPTMLLLTLVAMLVALAQRHWRIALALPLLVMGANQTTQLLKLRFLTDMPSDPAVRVTMPSGHSTAAISLAAVAIIAAPRILRPLVCLLAGAIAGGAGLGTMAERWHKPADVIAAVAVVLIWTSIAILIGARWVEQPLVRPAGFDRAVGHSALAVLGVAIGAGVLHRLGMAPVASSRAATLVYGSLIAVGLTIGLGLGLIAVLADRRIWRLKHSPARADDSAAVGEPDPWREPDPERQAGSRFQPGARSEPQARPVSTSGPAEGANAPTRPPHWGGEPPSASGTNAAGPPHTTPAGHEERER